MGGPANNFSHIHDEAVTLSPTAQGRLYYRASCGSENMQQMLTYGLLVWKYLEILFSRLAGVLFREAGWKMKRQTRMVHRERLRLRREFWGYE